MRSAIKPLPEPGSLSIGDLVMVSLPGRNDAEPVLGDVVAFNASTVTVLHDLPLHGPPGAQQERTTTLPRGAVGVVVPLAQRPLMQAGGGHA